jgi:hypothetical protein
MRAVTLRDAESMCSLICCSSLKVVAA